MRHYSGFKKTLYSHISEPLEVGEGVRTDSPQHVILHYGTEEVVKKSWRGGFRVEHGGTDTF